MTSHTPGPWSYDGSFTVGIPHIKGETFFRTNPEDAKLIAAAPEMAEALKAVLLFYAVDWTSERAAEWTRLTHSDDATTKALCDSVRAALAKAGL